MTRPLSPSPAGCAPVRPYSAAGAACPIRSSPRLIGREGFPAVTLDGQHGLWDTATIIAAVAAIRQGGSAPIVRIPVGEFASASRALDFGAEGLIAPMINTVADARAYVSFAKFPPLGERSWGPHRATTLAGMPDQKVYLREANELTVTFAMIETRTALDNVEAIAATPGIDALFLGPADLSIALSNGANVDPMARRRRSRDRPHHGGGDEGRQDHGRLLPHRRARSRAGEARRALPRGRQRPRLPAGRRRRRTQGCEGRVVTDRAAIAHEGPLASVAANPAATSS